MRHFIEFDSYGKVIKQSSLTNGESFLEAFPNAVEIPEALDHLNWYRDSIGTLFELPEQPDIFYTWTGNSWEDLRTPIENNNHKHELIEILRNKRDALLAKSDGYVMKLRDHDKPVPQEWIAYRQALRDLPNQAGVPYEVEWPVAPTT